MDALPSLTIWGSRFARLGIACWIAATFLAMSSFSLPAGSLEVLGWLGFAFIVLGFLGWRRTLQREGINLPLRGQLLRFARPLVGLLILVGGLTIAGASLAADQVSVLYLMLAASFIVLGAALAHGPLLSAPHAGQEPRPWTIRPRS